MKLVLLLVVAVCYLHPTCIKAQDNETDTNTTTEAATNDTNTTDMMGGSGMFLDITENTTTVDDVTSNVTTSSTEQPSGARLATSEIVGIVVGVIALAILVSLLTAIVIILCIKSTIKAKKVAPDGQKTKTKMDSNVTAHGNSEPMKELPLVDS